MKVLICSDSFKHSLTAFEVCTSLSEGLQSTGANWQVTRLPLADGGEGTVRALVDATGGEMVGTRVHDPLMRKTTAMFGLLGDGETAVIEMAAASGLERLKESERNPFFTTSYGTGELIEAALDRGCRKIILGIGGSATIDGGAGLLHALGALFYDPNDQPILPTGEKLNYIRRIDTQRLDTRLKETTIAIASDVDNPLTGERGAASVYGPQKGAQPGDVKILDKNLEAYAHLLKEYTNKDLFTMPGTGAAGGLAVSLLAFSLASLENGFNLIARELKLEEAITRHDVMVTGEGRIDAQTGYGKTPMGVARLAHKHNRPVIAVAGSIDAGAPEAFDLLLPIVEKPISMEEALDSGKELLYRTGQRIGKILRLSSKLTGGDS